MAIVKLIGVPRTNDPRELRKWMEDVAKLFSYQTYAGVPTNNIVPRWIGDLCLSSGTDWYKAAGVTAASWKALT